MGVGVKHVVLSVRICWELHERQSFKGPGTFHPQWQAWMPCSPGSHGQSRLTVGCAGERSIALLSVFTLLKGTVYIYRKHNAITAGRSFLGKSLRPRGFYRTRVLAGERWM